MNQRFDRSTIQGELGTRLIADRNGDYLAGHREYFISKKEEIERLLSRPMDTEEFRRLKALSRCVTNAVHVLNDSWETFHRS